MSEGYTTARSGALDGTFVAANATRHHLVSLERLERRIAHLDAAIAEDERLAAAPPPPAPADDTGPPAPVAGGPPAEAGAPRAEADSAEATTGPPAWRSTTPGGRVRQRGRYREARRRLGARHAANARRRKDKRKAADTIRISLADLDAVLGLDKFKVFRPLYNVQVMTDLGSDLILAFAVVPTTTDSGQLVPMIARTEESTGVAMEGVLTDAGYVSGPDLAAAAARDVLVYAPWQENDFTAEKEDGKGPPAPLPKARFTWDGERRQYLCPAGHRLSYARTGSKQKNDGESVALEIYQADAADCRACPLRAGCVRSATGARTVRRQPDEEHVEELRARMATAEAKALYRKRSAAVERSFADLKQHRNLERFSGRGQPRAQVQVGCSVLVHNLRVLAKLRAARAAGQRDEERTAT